MLSQKSYIDTNGRLAIPAKIRQKLKLKPGDEVSLKYTESELVVSTFQSNLEKARSILEKYKDINLSKELTSLRQEDAAKE
jgi:AbrB family looped-hinge helix DNA binding protein